MATIPTAPNPAGYQFVHPERKKRSISKFDSALNFIGAVFGQSSYVCPQVVNFGPFDNTNHSN